MPPKKKQGAPAEAKLEKLTVPKLRTELKKLGLDTNGLKVVLVARLKEALASDDGALAETARETEPAPASEPKSSAKAAARSLAKQSPAKMPPGRSSRGARAEADTPKPASEPAPEPALEPAPEREPYEMEVDAPAKRKIEACGKGSKLAPDASKERPPARSPPGKRKKRDPNVPVVSRGETTAPGQKIRVEPLAGEKKKPRSGGGSGGGLTVAAIASNALTVVAAKTWRRAEGEPIRPWDESIVVRIYVDELGGGDHAPQLQRVQLLEISQYLESYLWPHFNPKRASHTHVMSIIAMVNEKRREGVDVWAPFRESADTPEKFVGFFRRVMAVESEASLSTRERTSRLVFLVLAFQSLEEEMVRNVTLPLVSLPLWANLSSGRLQLELQDNAQLEKHWRYLMKKEAKAAKAAAKEGSPAPPPLKDRPESAWLPTLVDDFLSLCERATGSSDAIDTGVDAAAVSFCERFIEFVIDLLSQLPTRRFARTVLDDRRVLVKARMMPLRTHPAGRLYSQLVDLFAYYDGFEINDHTGAPLTDEDVTSAHCDSLLQFQRLCFKHVDKLRDLALSHCGAIERREILTKHLSRLDARELAQLATCQLKLVDPDDAWASNSAFLLETVVTAFEKRRSQRQAINEMPLYPNEDVLWDENVVPSVAFTGEGCLALPKLNLQFLTLQDYLLRNFNLFRLEATYEVREDIADVLSRLAPRLDPVTNQTKFSGWARMATPIAPGALVVTEVRKPNIGDTKPAAVTCEVRLNLGNLRGSVRDEWDQLKQHDVVFLLAAEGPTGTVEVIQSDKSITPAERYGLKYARGAEVIEVRDGEGKLYNDFTGRSRTEDGGLGPSGYERVFVLALDAAQYQLDVNDSDAAPGGKEDVYATINVLVRRKPKENNFKAILQCIRDLMNANVVVPEWLHDVFLGYGDPAAAQGENMPDQLRTVDFKDTFLDADHLVASFPGCDVQFVGKGAEGGASDPPAPPFRVTFPETTPGTGGESSESRAAPLKTLLVESYVPPDPGPYPKDRPNLNTVRFTPVQVEAIHKGVQPGLTMVVGPPGTGKTDTATQILHCLYHNEPGQRTLLITHSNAALNDLFQKLMQRNVPARYLLRLGQGEADLDTDLDFSRAGRVNAMLARRLELLAHVERLAASIGVSEDVAYTCETAGHFWLLHVLARWEKFEAEVATANVAGDPKFVLDRFPFKTFFTDAPGTLFHGESLEDDMRRANGCMRHIRGIFAELEECRAFELLKGAGDRSNYLLTRQAKVVAMTCTHAALKRHDFLRLGFKYDNLVMEESAQVLDIETFIPMMLQTPEDGRSRLKRVVLIGDHHQLPPVVKNIAFQKYCNMDQSLFARFVRLGIPYVELNAQGRARPELSALYRWRYRELGDLPCTTEGAHALANPGFKYQSQFVDVADYDGHGETMPTPYFYQNLGEAEYLVSTYQYMRLIGYPASKISIVTTYRGQKHLIRDVVARRCANHPLFGTPRSITTVDKFQGQQNDYVLLSLVRTRAVGHVRDVRRLVVALSRARLGLYVFGRRALFEQCYELAPAFEHLLRRPTNLEVVTGERFPPKRPTTEPPAEPPATVADVIAMGNLVNALAAEVTGTGMVGMVENVAEDGGPGVEISHQ